jgi:hypothetical protein
LVTADLAAVIMGAGAATCMVAPARNQPTRPDGTRAISLPQAAMACQNGTRTVWLTRFNRPGPNQTTPPTATSVRFGPSRWRAISNRCMEGRRPSPLPVKTVGWLLARKTAES